MATFLLFRKAADVLCFKVLLCLEAAAKPLLFLAGDTWDRISGLFCLVSRVWARLVWFLRGSIGAWRQINLIQDHEVLAALSSWLRGGKGLLTRFIRCWLLNLYFWLASPCHGSFTMINMLIWLVLDNMSEAVSYKRINALFGEGVKVGWEGKLLVY